MGYLPQYWYIYFHTGEIWGGAPDAINLLLQEYLC